jgi:hypothetical protein
MAQNINLIERSKAQRTPRDAVRQAMIALTLLLAVGATLAALQWRTMQNTRAELARVRAESERLQAAQADAAAPTAAWMAALAREEREVVELETIAHQLSEGSFGHTHGFTGQLRAFARATAPGIWLTGMHFDNTTSSMSLDGTALDASRVPALIQALQANPHFAGTRFASMELRSGEADASGKPRTVAFHIVTPASGGTDAQRAGATP